MAGGFNNHAGKKIECAIFTVKHIAATMLKDIETRGASEHREIRCRLPCQTCQFVSSFSDSETALMIAEPRIPFTIALARCEESMWSRFRVNELIHSFNGGGIHGPTAAHSFVFGSEL